MDRFPLGIGSTRDNGEMISWRHRMQENNELSWRREMQQNNELELPERDVIHLDGRIRRPQQQHDRLFLDEDQEMLMLRAELSNVKNENARLTLALREKNHQIEMLNREIELRDRAISRHQERERQFGRIYDIVKSFTPANEDFIENTPFRSNSLNDVVADQKNGISLPRNMLPNNFVNGTHFSEMENSAERLRSLPSHSNHVQNGFQMPSGSQSDSIPKLRGALIPYNSPQISTAQPFQRRSLQPMSGQFFERQPQLNLAQKRSYSSAFDLNSKNFERASPTYGNSTRPPYFSPMIRESLPPTSTRAMWDDEMEIYVLSCGFGNLEPIKTERFDCIQSQWTPMTICDGLERRSWFTLPTFGPMQQHLYVLGGTYFRENDTNYQTGRFEAFNLETGAWTELCPMPTQRANLTSFCFNDGQEIFACGGWINKYADTNRTDGYSLNDVECFVMERNRWLSMREMREIRGLPMGITLDENTAYVIGGFDGAERVRLRSGERYDRREGHWTNISPMNEARSVAGCALIDGRIYLVGGCNGEATNTVEIYEPRMNAWSYGPAMNSARTNLAAVFDGHRYLYAIGGRSTEKQKFSSIEVLDTQSVKAKWRKGPSMESIAGSCKAIAVQKGPNPLSSFIVQSEPIIKAAKMVQNVSNYDYPDDY